MTRKIAAIGANKRSHLGDRRPVDFFGQRQFQVGHIGHAIFLVRSGKICQRNLFVIGMKNELMDADRHRIEENFARIGDVITDDRTKRRSKGCHQKVHVVRMIVTVDQNGEEEFEGFQLEQFLLDQTFPSVPIERRIEQCAFANQFQIFQRRRQRQTSIEFFDVNATIFDDQGK